MVSSKHGKVRLWKVILRTAIMYACVWLKTSQICLGEYVGQSFEVVWQQGWVLVIEVQKM